MDTVLDRFFRLSSSHTNVKIELLAGFSTFLTMSYILFINPQILHATGMNFGAVFVATCLIAATGSLLTGFLANYPMALGPGMALNVYFTFQVVLGLGLSWQTALGAVFISGLLYLAIVLTPARRWLIESIPENLNIGVAVGVGLFIALLALKSSAIIIPNPNTFMALGSVITLPAILFFVGFLLIVMLEYLKVTGSIALSIITVTILSILLKASSFHGILSAPPSIVPTFFALDFNGLFNIKGISVILSFLLVALFDTTGTLIGLSQEEVFEHDPQRMNKISKVVVIDSIVTIMGACLGTASVSPFVESEAGIRAGGRTGLTAITIGGLFILALFFAPLAATIPPYAVAPALLYVGIMMIKNVAHIHSDDITEFLPSIITALMIPCTFSIADGLGFGIISYVLFKLFTRQIKQLNPTLIILATIFTVYFILK